MPTSRKTSKRLAAQRPAAQRPAAAARPGAGRRAKRDAVDARAALLSAATRLFAEQGIAVTTTREICAAAGLNPGAIHYHFGDKDGLYRAVLTDPIEQLNAELAGFDDPALPLRDMLKRVLLPFMADDDHPDERALMQLFLNEMQRPSPVFSQVFRELIAPVHERMAVVLARHMGLDAPDASVNQLLYGLQAMAHDYCLSRPLMDLMTPGWLDTPGALDAVGERLVDWGLVLIEHEKRRRSATQKTPKKTAR
ncbi:TetR/AcrR family transcriptional regulator [Roseateles sp. DC23W]|uniref:TetR/AcrR family transcriptional regulator n=1 Tax=Pelomonas dachongensis TaxID=3299029 RepID=A0ABW7ERI4_9BURK